MESNGNRRLIHRDGGRGREKRQGAFTKGGGGGRWKKSGGCGELSENVYTPRPKTGDNL